MIALLFFRERKVTKRKQHGQEKQNHRALYKPVFATIVELGWRHCRLLSGKKSNQKKATRTRKAKSDTDNQDKTVGATFGRPFRPREDDILPLRGVVCQEPHITKPSPEGEGGHET